MTPTTTSCSPLPTLADRPAAVAVIYDGDCRFCTGQVRRLSQWDTGGRLAYLSLHDTEVARRYPDLTHEQMMEQMYVVDHSGRRQAGAAAFRYLTRLLPRLWPLAPLMHLPFSLPLWQWIYRQVARRRYRIAGHTSCENDTCRVHADK